MARAAGCATARSTAAAEPISRTAEPARVIAVYSVCRFAKGDSAGGSMIVTRANSLPCARCTVIAWTLRTAGSRATATVRIRLPRRKAATLPAAEATTTPVSPLNNSRSASLADTRIGSPR